MTNRFQPTDEQRALLNLAFNRGMPNGPNHLNHAVEAVLAHIVAQEREKWEQEDLRLSLARSMYNAEKNRREKAEAELAALREKLAPLADVLPIIERLDEIASREGLVKVSAVHLRRVVEAFRKLVGGEA